MPQDVKTCFGNLHNSRRLHRPISERRHLKPVTDILSSSVSNPEAYSLASRHVILPFDIHQDPAQFHDKSNYDLLFNLFPGVQAIGFDDYTLTFRFLELPAQPWPKTVAGVPSYLTADPNDQGPTGPLGHWSRSRISLQGDLDLRRNDAAVGLIFDLVRDFCSGNQIAINEIQFWGSFVIIVLDHDSDDVLDAVPGSVARCPCFYLFEAEVWKDCGSHVLRAKPTLPSHHVDDTKYQTLRPGVMISAGKPRGQDDEILSSSGILVKDKHGRGYMTAAAHAFPDGDFDTLVYHPRFSDTPLGRIETIETNTDIALIRLARDVHYVNEPFENTVNPGPPVKFKEFARAASTRLGESCRMDTPSSGYVEGTKRVHAIRKLPRVCAYETKDTWIPADWLYMGQGSSMALSSEGAGSVVWNTDHQVTGFFRYAPQSGIFKDYAQVIAADNLIDDGYTIA
ncbi:hypothetical protein P168DRAFT_320964 [Aspergillus campestris IBT 28561]|uniref:Uncharacterized protein n=1 Tax=Aspergillus campestris (strain IBT 28561) TaxID=1392248 RepID=A0A2I1CUS5_ASPC2|nr:uncharacterized protein P168DRAFT_320964 [Aspergillus campestris IBT 28561]PKY01369.1 hypothetical protein P168DRAFT_320964 [Aspergillus campestris IBT 28561]